MVNINGISMDRWHEAQRAEREFHDKMSFEQGRAHYANSNKHYFFMLDIDPLQILGKKIMEVGPADFPALTYTLGFAHGIIVEPMPSENLRRSIREYSALVEREFYEDPKFTIIQKPMEEVGDATEDSIIAPIDEIWLLNVVQHVIDPNLFIQKAKALAPVIRFFEPILTEIEVYHPHTFDMDYFRQQFGDCTRHFPGGVFPGFHSAECAYGIWRR